MNLTQEPRKKLMIKSEVVPVVTESPIPEPLTLEILGDFQVNSFPSSILEDFIISKLESNNLEFSEEDIARIEASLLALYEKSEALLDDVEKKISLKELQEDVLSQVLLVAKRLGATEENVKEIGKAQISLERGFGYSAAGNKNIRISLLQVARKSMDMSSTLGIPEAEAFNILFRRVLAHELGHIVDETLNMKSNSIPSDKVFGNGENKMERFAEFVAESVLNDEDKFKNNTEKKLNVLITNLVYNSVRKFNEHGLSKIGIFQIFAKLKGKIKNQKVLEFLESRQILYSTAVPENYAKPFKWEDFVK